MLVVLLLLIATVIVAAGILKGGGGLVPALGEVLGSLGSLNVSQCLKDRVCSLEAGQVPPEGMGKRSSVREEKWGTDSGEAADMPD